MEQNKNENWAEEAPAATGRRSMFVNVDEIKNVAAEALNVLETQPERLAPDAANLSGAIPQFQPDALKAGEVISPGANKVGVQRDIGPAIEAAIDAAILALDRLEMAGAASTLPGPNIVAGPATLQGIAPQGGVVRDGTAPPETIQGLGPQGGMAREGTAPPETIPGIGPQGGAVREGTTPPKTERGLGPQGGTIREGPAPPAAAQSFFLTGGEPAVAAPAKPAADTPSAPRGPGAKPKSLSL